MATKKEKDIVSAPTLNQSPTTSTLDTTSWDDTTKGKEALDNYNTAKDAVTGYGNFTYGNQNQLNDLIGKILNREKFTYDLNGDALYQQYKDKYTQQAKMAMGDAIGQASAMTGGYGNSYAQSVGQQMYQKEMQNLNDIVPELYQMALDKYNTEGQDLYNQYGLLSDDYNREYGAWNDTYGRLMDTLGIYEGDYYNGADMFYTEQSNRNNAEMRAFDEAMQILNRDDSNAWKESEWNRDQTWRDEDIAYRDERDAIEDERYEKEWEYTTSQDTLKNIESNAKLFYETGGKLGYDNGSVSTDNIKLMQEFLGIDADGKWGSGSTEAAGGLTADEAWKAYQNGTLGKAEFNYDDFVDDLNYFIKQGADKSEINNYLREALQSGYITQAEYNKLKETYAPRGYTYSTGGGGRTKDTTIAYK